MSKVEYLLILLNFVMLFMATMFYFRSRDEARSAKDWERRYEELKYATMNALREIRKATEALNKP